MCLSELLGLPNEKIHYFSLGRHALSAALYSLGVGKGDYVLIPEFICRDLLAAIYSVHAEPIFYEIGKDLTPHALPFHKNIKAVVAVNYFGFPQKLDLFYEYCNKHSVILVEDNAHGFISRDHDGVLLGARADIGIFSFRKTFFLPNGAAFVESNLISPLKKMDQLKCDNYALPVGYYVKNYLGLLQTAININVRGYAEKIVRLIRKIKTGSEFPPTSPDSELNIPGSPEIHCRSLSILGKKKIINESNRRRELYLKFSTRLQTMNIEPVYMTLPDNTVPYGYPFFSNDSEVVEHVRKEAWRHGLDVINWPDLPDAIVDDAPAHYKSIWLINFLC